MQNRTLILLITSLLALCLLCACACAVLVGAWFVLAPAQVTSEPAAQSVPVIPTDTFEMVCTASMQQVIQASEGLNPDSETGPDANPGLGSQAEDLHPDQIDLVRYRVEGDTLGPPLYESVTQNLKTLQHDTQTQAEVWRLFTGLIPAGQRDMIQEYVFFTDGPGNTLASVYQSSYDDPSLWALSIDAADAGDRDALIFTLVHEFAHLLTLNVGQVTPDMDLFYDPGNTPLRRERTTACPTYFPGEGCSRADSYMNAFHARFWPDLMDEWQAVDDMAEGDLEAYFEALYAFYEAHADQFVTEYAATNTSEDIADSFSYFVFGARPAGGSIAEQKVLFFYEYPELRQLRQQVLGSFCEVPQ